MPTIFITGASSGIGKAAARLFAEKGWEVIANMRHTEKEGKVGALLLRGETLRSKGEA
ncbi:MULTISPECIES: SDR family NAD(P)-dependent oxidoreductase [unclassified Desulfovibrio]|uniref:SDR family NAD(P)-dependent oxidoreductase n=1 Tax=unclassified Desulfovibrio TaxID=2593640 RepID=UPI0013EBC266|nr:MULTISPECIES: SDR family NAD(P)-dependent oxidoreductase [unclassified Desulfovibrio]